MGYSGDGSSSNGTSFCRVFSHWLFAANLVGLFVAAGVGQLPQMMAPWASPGTVVMSPSIRALGCQFQRFPGVNRAADAALTFHVVGMDLAMRSRFRNHQDARAVRGWR